MELLDLRLFLDSRDRSSTDARDKVYALRGITDRGDRQGHPGQLQRLRGTRVYGLFEACAQGPSRSADSFGCHPSPPSGVTARSCRHMYRTGACRNAEEVSLQRYYRFKPTHLFKAGGQTAPQISMSQGSDVIRLQGRILDTVVRVIDIKKILLSMVDSPISVTESVLRQLAAAIASSDTYSFTGESSWMACFRTITADRTALSPRISDQYRSQFFSSLSSVNGYDPTNNSQTLPPSAWAAVSEGIATIIEDKDMFVTAQGYLGLGHEGFEAGDVVCVFSGDETPFLLGQSTIENETAFRFLSECYVHGVMDGEAMKDTSTNPLLQIPLV